MKNNRISTKTLISLIRTATLMSQSHPFAKQYTIRGKPFNKNQLI